MNVVRTTLVATFALGVATVLSAAAPTAALAAGRVSAATTGTGFDISYPQCSAPLPSGGAFGVVGVTYGKPWSTQPCVAREYTWAAGKTQAPSFYMNTANPGPVSSHWNQGGPRACVNPASASDTGCAYDYGWNAAAYSVSAASSATSTNSALRAWWLDVETANSWNGDGAANAADLQGSVDYLHTIGVGAVGVYSTSYQWGVITGGYRFAASQSVTDWLAGGTSLSNARQRCAGANSFSGGSVKLSQYPAGSFDGDYRCF